MSTPPFQITKNCLRFFRASLVSALLGNVLVSFASGQSAGEPKRPEVPVLRDSNARARASYLHLPLSFEKRGSGAGEQYISRGPGYSIGFERGRATVALPATDSASAATVSLDFAGGRRVAATPQDELPGKVNYFIGNDPAKWKVGLPTYSKIAYADVYPGIDVVYYGSHEQLEFDFVVKPGADPRAIRLKVGGAKGLRLNGPGELVIDAGGRDLKVALPRIYQESAGARKDVRGRYVLRGADEVAFEVGSWDKTKNLIIDPTLVYSAMIGGGSSSSYGYAVTLDGSGNVYIAGLTFDSTFPVAAAAQAGYSASADGIVVKMNAAGTALIYSTYLGGTGYEILQGIATDSTGAAWVTGYTQSNDFPVLNPTQPAFGGGSYDSVVAKLSSSGALQFSTYLGGSGFEIGSGIATDSADSAYVTGYTTSTNFPTTAGALLTGFVGSGDDAFVAKFSSAGARAYVTYLGGPSSFAVGYGIAVDSTGSAYVTGYTGSPSFTGAPTGGAQAANGGSTDAFVAKLNPAGSALSYFTFLGGTNPDSGRSIVLDSSLNAYIAGTTSSTGIATTGAAQTTLNGAQNGFVAKLNPTGSAFTYVTYIGGNRTDMPQGVGIDSSGNAYVAGYTNSNVFPVTGALQPTFPSIPVSAFQTTNTGTSFAAFDTTIPGAIVDLTVDPGTPTTIIATGDGNRIYRTTNSGVSWTAVTGSGQYLARSPALSSTIYSCSSGTVYRSTDSGATFGFQGNGSGNCNTGLVADPLTVATIYGFDSGGGLGVSVSTNGGVSWTAANTGLPSTSVTSVVAESDGSLYASVQSFGIYKSTNQGGSWSAATTGLPSNLYTYYRGGLAAVGTTVYAAQGTIYKSTNGGANWTALTGSVPGGAYLIGVSPANPSVLYATGFSSPVYVSTDGGATWNLSGGLPTSNQPYSAEFVFDPSNAARAFFVQLVAQVGFAAELNSAGTGFVYSTYFGSTGGGALNYSSVYGVKTNATGDLFLTGYTSPGSGGAFPSTTTAFRGGTFGAFVARISNVTAACSVTLSPATQTVEFTQSAGISVVAPSGCAWSASSDQGWATITAGATGTGVGAITIQAAPNSTGVTRTATITAGGQSVTIVQADQTCFQTFTPSTFNLAQAGDTISSSMTTGTGCAWSIPNNYPGVVTFTSATAGTGNAAISATVAANAGLNSRTLSFSSTSGFFSATQAGTCNFVLTPTSATAAIAGGSSSFSFTTSSSACTWQPSSDSFWVTIQAPTSGTGSGTVNYTVAANSNGSRVAHITLGGFSFAITQAGSAPVLSGIVNDASFTSPAAPGSVASAFGSNLASVTQAASGTPLGTALGGSTLTVNGVAAPLFFVSAGQINFQVPSGTAAGTATAIVTSGGVSSSPFTFTVAATAPGIFTQGGTGTGAGMIVNADSTTNGASHPAPAGSIVAVSFTGGGSVTPSVADGNAPTGISVLTNAITALINGVPATVGFAGRAPGLVGYDQANVTVPSSLGAGTYNLTLTVGGVTSNTVTIVVAAPSITISTAPNLGTINTGTYQTALGATGGNGTFTWSLTSGALPPGISLRTDVPTFFTSSQQAGLIGVATTPGTYNFTLTCTSNGSSVAQAFTIRVTSLTTIDVNPPDVFVGTPFTYQFGSAGNAGSITYAPVASFPLPAGVTISSSGLLSGTAATAGFFTFAIDVSDGTDTEREFYVLSVYAIQVTSPGQLPNGTQNTSYSQTLTASGGTGSYTWTVVGSLPTGLTLSSAGLISGTITQSASQQSFQVRATDGNNVTYTKAMAIGIIGVPVSLVRVVSDYLDDATVGNRYSASVGPCCGGQPPFSWSATGLPAGMAVRTGSGNTSSFVTPGFVEIYGAPLVPGNYNVQLTVTDATAQSSTLVIPFHVGELDVANLASGSSSLPSGTINTPYTGTLRLLGGTPPYTVAYNSQLAGRKLPGGLTVGGSTLTVTGTPDENSFFSPVFQYTDSASHTVQRLSSLNITAPSSTITISESNGFNSYSNSAPVSVSFSRQFSASGAGAFTWSQAGGTLPPGLTISASGVLSGTPTTAGTYTFLLKAADSSNSANAGFKEFTLNISALSISTNALPFVNVGTPVSIPLASAGALGTVSWTTAYFPYLPPGLSLSSAGVLGGTPTSAGFYTFGVRATDSGSVAPAVKLLSISIYPAGQTPPLFLSLSQTFNTTLGAQRIQLQATGGTPPYHYSLTPNASAVPGFRVQDGAPLPTSFPTSSTGIGGVLGVFTLAGTYPTSIRVTDSLNATFDEPTTFVVSPVTLLDQSTLPKASVGVPYTYTFQPSGATNYTLAATGLPAGFSFNTATGVLSAASPTTSGIFNLTINVGDAAGGASFGFGFTLAVNSFGITDTALLPQATLGSLYSLTFTAPGCVNCSWTASSLSSPLSLSSGGVLTGTIGGTGLFSTTFTVTATGTNGTVSKIFTLMAPASTNQALSITTNITTSTTINNSAALALSATGGTSPYTFSFVSGTLPPGITVQGPGENLGGNLSPGFYYLAGRTRFAGTFTFTLQVTDAASRTATKAFTWVISATNLEYTSIPLTGTTLISGTPIPAPGQPLLVIGGTGSYTAWSAANNPIYAGLSLNGSTGVITGTPTDTGGVTQILNVTDSGGNTLASNLTITAASNAVTTISLGGPAFGTVVPLGISFFGITPSGGTAPYTVSPVTPLPAGFTALGTNAGTTTVSGGGYNLYLNATTAGTYTFTLQATDANGVSGQRTYSIVVADFTRPSTTTLFDGSLGVPYSQQLYVVDTASTINVSVASGSALPPGLSVSASGLLSGTPIANGTYTFSLAFTDSTATLTSSFQLRISGIAITNPVTLDPAFKHVSYSYAMTSTGGSGAITWSSPNLPFGLSISAAGVITGTPRTSLGRYVVTITATDGVAQISKNFALWVRTPNADLMSLSAYNGTQGALPDASLGAIYTFGITPNGGVAPHVITVAPGSTLPAGLSLIPAASLPNFSPGATVLFGMPTTPGDYSFSLLATDAAGAQITRTFTLKISALHIVLGNPPNATIGVPYSAQITAVGGTGPYTFTTVMATTNQEMLPAGLSISSGGLISGTPTSTGSYSFYLTAHDSLGATITRSVSLISSNGSGLYVDTNNSLVNYLSTGLGATVVPDVSLGIGTELSASTTTGAFSTYTWSLVGGALPPGTFLSRSGITTTFSGQPATAGNYTFTLRATDDNNASNFADHIFTGAVSPMQMVTPAEDFAYYLPPAHIGTAYNFQMAAAGGTPGYTYSLDALSFLPPGLTYFSSGTLVGTPTQGGAFNIRPIVTDANGVRRYSPGFRLEVAPAGGNIPLLQNDSARGPDASTGVNFLFPLEKLIVGGTPPFSWSVSGLPPGISVVPGANGFSSYAVGVSNVPGNYFPILTVSDSGGQTLAISGQLGVSPLQILPASIPPGAKGSAYSVNLTGAGGTAPYTFAYDTSGAGDFPAGLTLTQAGVLSGTPTSAGNYTIGVRVTDSASVSYTTVFEMTIDDGFGEAPAISINPKPLNISYRIGSGAPSATLTVTSTNSNLPFTAYTAGIPGASLSSAGGTTRGSTDLNIDPTSLTAGTYTGFVAVRSPQSVNYGDVVPVVLTVTSPVTCTVSLSSSANPSNFGQSPVLTASLTGTGCSTATGTMTFKDGSNGLGSTGVSNGSAFLANVTLSAGPHSLTAVYSGDAVFAGGTSNIVTQVVNQQTTGTTLVSSLNPSGTSQNVTFTATVTPAGAPGTVTFQDGATTLGTGTLSGGVASFSTSGLATGNHPISATYPGNADYLGSSSSTLTQTVALRTSTITLSTTVGPVNPGDNVTFTATITPSNATGTVTFQVDGTTVGTAPVTNGVATMVISFASFGPRGVTAAYGGDPNTSGITSDTFIQHVLHSIFFDSFNGAANSLWQNEAGNWSAANGVYSAANPSPSPNAHSLLPFALTDFRVHTETTQLGDGGVWLRATNSPGNGVGINGVLAVLKPGTGQVAFTVVQNGVYGPFNPSASITSGPHSFDIAVKGNNYSLYVDGSTTPLLDMDSTAFTTGQTGLYENVANGWDNFGVYFSTYYGTSSTTTTLTPSVNPSSAHQSVTFTATVSGPGATGTVAFLDGGQTVGTAPLNAGTASFSTTYASQASHALVASYSGDDGYRASDSAVLNQAVNQAVSTTTLTSSANPSIPGQNITLSASVSPAAATGTITFLDGSTSLGTVTLSNGVATLSTSGLALGSHTLSAAYGGDAADAPSSSAALTQNVSLLSTGIALSSSVNPSVFGQSVAFTATLSAPGATGTVSFLDGVTLLGTGTVSNGVATFIATSLSVADHSVTAAYSGDASYGAITSSAVIQTVNRVPAAVTLSSSANPSLIGQSLTLTASVLPASATGTVTFSDGANVLGTVPVTVGGGGTNLIRNGNFATDANSWSTSGGCSLPVWQSTGNPGGSLLLNSCGETNSDPTAYQTVAGLTIGATYMISVDVLADAVNSPNGRSFGIFLDNEPFNPILTTEFTDSAWHTVTVPFVATATTHTIAFAAELDSRSPGVPSATDVSYFIDNVFVGQPGTAATFNTSALSVGAHSLTAAYSGDANNTTSTSAALLQTVTLIPTTTTVSSTPNPALFGQQVTITATVTPAAATGTMTFKDGSTTLGTGPISAGVATFQTTTLGSGSHPLTAVYGGDSTYQTSTSAVNAQGVNQTPTTTSVTSNPTSLTFGQTVTFTATVFPSSATGLVTFQDGGSTLGTGALSGGLATFTTATLPAGSRQITAVYGGDVLDAVSTSAAITVTVNPAVSSISVSLSANQVTVNQSVTIRAAVVPSTATGLVTFRDGGSAIGSASLSSGTASITITPPFGSHSISAAYNGNGNYAPSTSLTASFSVSYSPISITTSSLPNGLVGQAYGPVSLSATGGSQAFSWTASGLPQGLSLSSTGTLSGTPAGSFSGPVSITVTDIISNQSGSTNLSLTISAPTLTISGPASLGNVLVGGAVAASYSATGGTSPYTWSISGASGITVDASGRVTGTAGAAGNFSLTLTVTDSLNQSKSQALPLSVFGITTSSLPPGTTTNDYGASVTVAGGAPPYTFAFSGLPAGITASGGSLSGRATTPNSYPVSVRVSEGGGLSATASYTISITGSTALQLISTSLPDATVGQPYSASLIANGGSTPYSWSQSGGVLPDGLSLGSGGTISGVATTLGAYSIGVQVQDANGRVVGTVSINVKPAPLVITNGAVFPSGVAGLNYPAQVLTASGGTPPYTFGVRGSLPAGLTLSSGQISGNPTNSGDSGFTLTVADSAATPATGLLGVTLTVRPASPDIVLSASSASFTIASGTSAAPVAAVIGVASSVLSQSLTYSATASVPWLSVSGGSSAPDAVSIALNNAALALTAAGSPYSGNVVIACTSSACAGKTQSITVSLIVTAPPPQLTLGTTLISFAAISTSPQASSASLGIMNSGGGTLRITSVTSDVAWLRVGSVPATVAPGPGVGVTVTADPTGLNAGYYRGTISVVTSNGSASAAVTLFVSSAATMSLAPAGRQLSLPQGGVLGNASGAFSVSTSGGATVPYTSAVVQGGEWLQVTGGSGSASAVSAGSVSYSLNPTAVSALAAGAYYGTIRVTGTGVVNSPLDFQVILNVTPANTPVIPDLQPAGLVFVSTTNAAPTSQVINVYASSRTGVPYQVSASTEQGHWLTADKSQGSASASSPGAVTVTAVPGAMPAGAYRGTVSYSFDSTVRTVNVTLIVQPSQAAPATVSGLRPADTTPACANAVLVPTQTGLVSNFSAPTSWPTPLSIKLFDSCGSTVGNAQIVASFTNGDPVLPLTSVTSGSGLYSATWTPRRASGQVTVLASVNAPGYPAASVKIAGQVSPNSAPVLAPNAAGDVFHPQVGAGLGPGNIVQIYGTGLASTTATPATLPLPTSMNGTSVLIGGVRAPLFYISPGQINAQIPFELAAGNQYQLIVNANGQLTTPQSLQLNGGTPAILNFTSGAVVAQHLDGTLILDSSPATPGEFVVIYSSGLGATDIAVPSGTASPADPPARVSDMPVLTLNGNEIKVLFAGLTPGLVGLYQVNFQVPQETGTGNYDLVLTQSGTASNKTVLNIQAPKN